MKLIDIYFRRTSLRLKYRKSFYISKLDLFSSVLNKLSKLLFFLTLGVFGKCNGWLGLYKKN